MFRPECLKNRPSDKLWVDVGTQFQNALLLLVRTELNSLQFVAAKEYH